MPPDSSWRLPRSRRSASPPRGRGGRPRRRQGQGDRSLRGLPRRRRQQRDGGFSEARRPASRLPREGAARLQVGPAQERHHGGVRAGAVEAGHRESGGVLRCATRDRLDQALKSRRATRDRPDQAPITLPREAREVERGIGRRAVPLRIPQHFAQALEHGVLRRVLVASRRADPLVLARGCPAAGRSTAVRRRRGAATDAGTD